MYDEFNNVAEVGVFPTTLVNDGNWHHIKGERTGTTIKMYVDGVLEATANTDGTVNSGRRHSHIYRCRFQGPWLPISMA